MVISYERRRVREAVELQVRHVSTAIATGQTVAATLKRIEEGLGDLSSNLDGALREVCASVDEGFDRVCFELALQHSVLADIKAHLMRPLDTQGKELRQRGETAFRNNWFDEAQGDLENAVAKNYQDFHAHAMLSEIYLRHRNDRAKALDAMCKASKYARPFSTVFAAAAAVRAAKLSTDLGFTRDAYDHAVRATTLDPGRPAAWFARAKAAAALGLSDDFEDSLLTSVNGDPGFLLAADIDPATQPVRAHFERIVHTLVAGTLKRVEQRIDDADDIANDLQRLGLQAPGGLASALAKARRTLTEPAYLDLLAVDHSLRDALRAAFDESVAEMSADRDKAKKRLHDLENASWIAVAGIAVGFALTVAIFAILNALFASSGPVEPGGGPLTALLGFFLLAVWVGGYFLFWLAISLPFRQRLKTASDCLNALEQTSQRSRSTTS